MKRTSRIRLAAGGAAPLIVSLMAGALPAHCDPVDDYVVSEMRARRIPGLSVAVLRDGQVIKKAAYGWASIEFRVPATTETLYDADDLSRMISTAALGELVELGKCGLSDPVGKFVSAAPAQWKRVAVKGLIEDDRAPSGLMNRMIESITGFAFERFAHERLFAPIGMTSSRFAESREIVVGRAAVYEQGKDHKLMAAPRECADADRIFMSSVSDLAKWASSAAGRRHTMIRGASCAYAAYSSGLTVIVLTNSLNSDAATIADRIAELDR